MELQERLKVSQEAESQARKDNQMLREESLMLRDKIVQLIKYVIGLNEDLYFLLLCNCSFFKTH